MQSPWSTMANEPTPHRLDSHTCVQIVLACVLVVPRGRLWIWKFYLFSICL